MGKMKTIGVFAVGYVVGARAGRGRYEQIKRRAKNLWEKPRVQEQVGKVSEQATTMARGATGKLPGMSGPGNEAAPDAPSRGARSRARNGAPHD